MYIDSCIDLDILYNCTQLVNVNFASAYTTHIDMKTLTWTMDIALYLYILFYCKQLVHMVCTYVLRCTYIYTVDQSLYIHMY